MASPFPFPLSNRVTDVRLGCKTQRIASTLRQAADLVFTRTKEREYFKTYIVGHVNSCLLCGPTLTVRYSPTSLPDNLCKKTGLVFQVATVSRIMRGHVMAPSFLLPNRANDVKPGCKTQMKAPTLRQVVDLVCTRTKERELFKTCIVGHVNSCLQCGPTLRKSNHIKRETF
ncbi:hypothetical protein PoB_007718300 [Plakobranchus ocellatus]|uniref:Uncharacterized protein n=1 Tax=Plakobranchus ocellatus TaxID=259542 RepID=A0AAV4E3G2_9GAST|nr:hypothetical protein PoB_007718300 [Plakobranchus ocellatus]